MKPVRLILLIGLQLFMVNAFANRQLDTVKSYQIKELVGEIKIDGKGDESDWENAQWEGNFYQHFPYDTSQAKSQTKFKVLSGKTGIYFLIRCYDQHPNKDYVVQSLKRDFSFPISDAVSVTITPFEDGQNGFAFGVNPENSQREGSVDNGGTFGGTTAWDQVGFSEVTKDSGWWQVEMLIPYKSIRYGNNKNWYFNIARNDLKVNEASCWVRVPRNLNVSSLGYLGILRWETPPKTRKRNVVLVPYLSGGGYFDHAGGSRQLNAGIDAKIGITGSLNLDLTVNPDFAQVDADVQQINLTRFSLFFPERRNFFLENSDLFSNFGFTQIRPFFSRNIGLSQGRQIPILGGVRLTGKAGNKWRIGVMDVQTDKLLNQLMTNYFVAAFQRKIFGASNISGIVVNQVSMNDSSNKFMWNQSNTIVGLDYNLLSKNNKWVGKVFYHRALKNGVAYAHASWINRRNIWWDIHWNHEFVGKDYLAQTGFVPRVANFDPLTRTTQYLTYWRLEPWITRTFYPKKNTYINNFKARLYHSSYYDSAFKGTDIVTELRGIVNFQNSASFYLFSDYNDQRLFLPFNPTNAKDSYLVIGKYQYANAGVGGQTNQRRVFNFSGSIGFGNYYIGKKTTFQGALNYRLQPRGIFSFTYRRDQIHLPGIDSTQLHLLGARIEWSFSTVMYLTTFVQYNTQLENVNCYVRFQWRFYPMSDFFLVYSQNLNTEFQHKDALITGKLVLWIR